MFFAKAALFAAVLILISLSAKAAIEFSGPVEIGRIQTGKVTEASGLAASRNSNILWTHNDGNSSKVYALTSGGNLLASFDITRTTSDLEDIAIGPGPVSGVDYLYMGDIGSNDGSREKPRVYRVQEPQVSLDWAGDPKSKDFQGVERFNLVYPNGESHDAEGMIVDPLTGDLLIFAKMEANSRVFRAAAGSLVPEKETVMEFIAEIPLALVSGAAISRDGKYVAARREDAALLWARQPNQSLADLLGTEPLNLPVVGPPDEPNGEAIAFLPSGGGYVTTSEGEEQGIFEFTLHDASPAAAPRFTSLPRWTADGWVLPLAGSPGETIVVEASTDLRQWDEIGQIQLRQTTAEFIAPFGLRAFFRLRTPG